MLNLAQIPKPANVPIEKSLIGAVLRNNDLVYEVEGIVSAQNFFDPSCREIYALIEEEARAAKAFDEHLLASRLSSEDRETMLECRENRAAPNMVIPHAKAIAELSARRELMTLGFDLLMTSTNEGLNVNEIAEKTENRIDQIRQGSSSREEAENVGVIARRICAKGAELYQSGQEEGLKSGIQNLDNIMLPLRRKNFVIIAGRPAQGKTALALNICHNIALAAEMGLPWAGPVAMLSYEMSKEEAIERILAREFNISSSEISNGNFCGHPELYMKVQEYARRLESVPFFVETPDRLTADNLYAHCLRLKRKYGVKMVIIDYLQLMDGGEKLQANDRITRISKACKRAAARLDIVIVGLSQLSRAIENREDKTPLLSDLRESGSLEQDADLIIFCYRDEYYLALSEPPPTDIKYLEWAAKMEIAKGNATLIVGKQRRGRQGRVNVRFCGTRTLFY
jgi:replicative DNA helicase